MIDTQNTPRSPGAPSRGDQLKVRRFPKRLLRPFKGPANQRRSMLVLGPLDPDMLRQWRRMRYLAQADLAALLNVRWITVQRWELGKSRIPYYLQLALERLDDLLVWHPDGALLNDQEPEVPDMSPPHMTRGQARGTAKRRTPLRPAVATAAHGLVIEHV